MEGNLRRDTHGVIQLKLSLRNESLLSTGRSCGDPEGSSGMELGIEGKKTKVGHPMLLTVYPFTPLCGGAPFLQVPLRTMTDFQPQISSQAPRHKSKSKRAKGRKRRDSRR